MLKNEKKSSDFPMVNFSPSCIVFNQNNSLTHTPYSPFQIKNLYSFPENIFGADHTVAIITAYGNPNILSDLDVFNKKFNLNSADIELAYVQEKTSEISPIWALETSLAVQWVHALAPYTKILLVIAKSNSRDDLYEAVDYAVKRGVSIVSIGWGTDEYKNEILDDYHFNVPGVAFLAASGNNSSPSYPSVSPYTVSIGATSVQIDSFGKRISHEIAWSKSGGGISLYEPKPSYQNIANNAKPVSSTRTVPDVAFFGDSFPGVFVYTSTPVDGKYIGWLGVGGTSVSTCCWAGILANISPPQNKFFNIHGILYGLAGGNCYTNPYNVYSDTRNGNNGYYPSLLGYDYVSGLGTPNVSNLVENFNSIQCNCSCYCNYLI